MNSNYILLTIHCIVPLHIIPNLCFIYKDRGTYAPVCTIISSSGMTNDLAQCLYLAHDLLRQSIRLFHGMGF